MVEIPPEGLMRTPPLVKISLERDKYTSDCEERGDQTKDNSNRVTTGHTPLHEFPELM